jgi:NADH-quinone oxidoreductase subunit F
MTTVSSSSRWALPPAQQPVRIVTKNFDVPESHTLAVYRQQGGYEGFRKAAALEPTAVVDEVKRSNLRGRGGAGFATGLKWSFIPKGSPTVYLVVNADESEPGTCKDREILARDPHLLIEGVMIAAYAIGCRHAYIYIRGEMIREAKFLQGALDEVYAAGLLGRPQACHPTVGGGSYQLDVTVHRGAGAYICGEETALLNSLEGKRGWPRMKPPFPAVQGLFGKPTIVNNVETLANLPAILVQGADWFAGLGVGKSGGTRLLCVSGHVARPGVYELRMGIPLREVIYDVCGGIPNGRTLKAVIPGGSSMPVLDASEIDVPMEFDALMTDGRIKEVEVAPGQKLDMGGGRPLRTMAGSGGVIVMDDSTDLVAVCARIMKFYAHESCGQCTPCREGTGWLARVCGRLARNQARPGDVEMLASIAHGIAGNTICPLGEAAAWPMLAFLTKFRAEFEQRLARAVA